MYIDICVHFRNVIKYMYKVIELILVKVFLQQLINMGKYYNYNE
jgi:hypothetical protein